jgi:HD-GYP domain-containing protein (c-di-GMP phosphodiesterase class II)
MPPRLRAYVVLVSLLGMASLWLPPTWEAAPLDWLAALTVLTALSIVLEFVNVPLPAAGRFSMATISHVATILLVPAPFAAISVGVSVLVEEAVRRVPPPRMLFNAAGMTLTASLASFAGGAFGNVWASSTAGSGNPGLLLIVAVVAITYFGLNALLLGLVFAIVERRPILGVLRRSADASILGELATTAIGAHLALIWVIEPLLIVVLAVPTAVIARSFGHIRRLNSETRAAVRNLAEIVDHRDPTTYYHSGRVAVNAARLSRVLALSDEQIELIEQAAAVHDLGKIGVPDRVLLKPGRLTRDEFDAMRRHTELGSDILTRFELFRPGAEIVRHHHERWDGTGYPAGLAGETIPIGARVIAVADAFDAMTSARPYRAPLSRAEATRRLEAGAGTQWDPQIVAAFVAMLAGAEAAEVAPRRAATRSPRRTTAKRRARPAVARELEGADA